MEKQIKQIKAILIGIGSLMAIMCMAVLVTCFSVLAVVPKANKLLKTCETEIQKADVILDEMAEITSEISESDLVLLVTEANQLVEDSTDVVAAALDKINSFDIKTLNSAIKDLQTIVEPLANITNMFGKH